MSGGLWVVVGLDAVTASILLIAGMAKLVSPTQLGQALAELPFVRGQVPAGAVRTLAAVEIAAALLLPVPATRTAAAAAAGVLGLGFVGAGLAGWLGGSTTACGCFGSRAGRPLGPVNVAAGVLVIVSAAVTAGAPAAAGPAHYFRICVVGLALATLCLCLWTHRGLIRELTRPLSSSR
jgi:hypothetical protein